METYNKLEIPRTKLQSYTSALLALTKLAESSAFKSIVDPAIKEVKRAILNHEPDPAVISSILYSLVDQLPEETGKALGRLAHDIESYKYSALTTKEKFENPLRRRLESTLFIQLLTQPTAKMMEAVKTISTQIANTIATLKAEYEEIYKGMILEEDGYLDHLRAKKNIIACGAFDHYPTIEEVEELLEENDAKKLPSLMHAHFKFACHIYRKVPLLTVPNREPVGQFKKIVEDNYGSWEEYLLQIKLDSEEGYEARKIISDDSMSHSALYTQEDGSRGRRDAVVRNFTTQLGLMLVSQERFAVGLPHYGVRWVPDAKGQQPNYASAYVIDALHDEDLYVSGPSGMTALFLGLSEVIANFDTIEMKQHYLAATAAYIVGAGFHCTKEVFDPAQWALALIEGYPVVIPTKGDPVPGKGAVFFERQAEIDPQFAERIEKAWADYLIFYENVFLPTQKPSLPSVERTTFFDEKNSVTKRKQDEQEKDIDIPKMKKDLIAILDSKPLKTIINPHLITDLLNITTAEELYFFVKDCVNEINQSDVTVPRQQILNLNQMEEALIHQLKRKKFS